MSYLDEDLKSDEDLEDEELGTGGGLDDTLDEDPLIPEDDDVDIFASEDEML